MLGRMSPVYKADLATGLVREFPELQGVIGGHYWRWENREVLSRPGEGSEKILLEAEAISEHYHPRFPGDTLPESLLGRILAATDKYLYQVAAFKAGLSPSGSEDPYAVRRSGTGLIALLADSGWSISVKDLAERSAGVFGEVD
ncbi:glycyl-tRNA synthetase beta subunit, partial [mine drainage metagenome]